jgi:hypothetical protein
VKLAVNVAVCQVGWLACVLDAAHGVPWIGVAVAAAAVAWPGWHAPEDLKLVAVAVLVGALFDSALAAAGWVVFKPDAFAESVAPYWILALWALLATTLNVSLGWLRTRLVLAAPLGGLPGPLAYWAGARLGALDLVHPIAALAALALGWAAILPGLLAVAGRIDRRPA